MNQLKLALAWNRIDIVREEIFTEEKNWDVSMKICSGHKY